MKPTRDRHEVGEFPLKKSKAFSAVAKQMKAYGSKMTQPLASVKAGSVAKSPSAGAQRTTVKKRGYTRKKP